MATTLFDPSEQEPRPHRIESLAGILAGFGWPERGSLEKLTKEQQALARETAREALLRIGAS